LFLLAWINFNDLSDFFAPLSPTASAVQAVTATAAVAAVAAVATPATTTAWTVPEAFSDAFQVGQEQGWFYSPCLLNPSPNRHAQPVFGDHCRSDHPFRIPTPYLGLVDCSVSTATREDVHSHTCTYQYLPNFFISVLDSHFATRVVLCFFGVWHFRDVYLADSRLITRTISLKRGNRTSTLFAI
jgi:hypothetical protein